MSLSGSSLLARIARNPQCGVQVAMALSRWAENRFVEAVTGQPYLREFGERQSARRRGRQFEQNLVSPPGDARLLREVIAEIVKADADQIAVRDLSNEVPGNNQDTRVARLGRTRQIIADTLKCGKSALVVIQPQLLIPTNPGPRPYFFIAPDFMIWIPNEARFLPGDAKSFVVREGYVEPGDLEQSRLQLGSHVIALRHEFARFGAADRITDQAALVCSTPYGLHPARPTIEDVAGAVAQVERSIDVFVEHRNRAVAIAAGAPMHLAVDQLPNHFQENCLSNCALAEYCRNRHPDAIAELGDCAARTFGRDNTLTTILGLLSGEQRPKDDRERELAQELRRVADEIHNPRKKSA